MRNIAVAVTLTFASLSAPLASAAQTNPRPVTHVIASVDLAQPFGTRAPWRFIATQGADEPDALDAPGSIPGTIYPCITADNARTCLPDTQSALRLSKEADDLSVPHFLFKAEIDHASTGRPLLLLRLGSFRTGNGDQVKGTQIYTYDGERDTFELAYAHHGVSNNNQEVRLIVDGPLKGDIISVDPTSDAPFGYWVSVNSLAAGSSFKEVLHYRSATAYNDGNPLAVIDAEMPNIQKRMGLWKPGMPLPAPQHGCTLPHLVKSVLWCS